MHPRFTYSRGPLACCRAGLLGTAPRSLPLAGSFESSTVPVQLFDLAVRVASERERRKIRETKESIRSDGKYLVVTGDELIAVDHNLVGEVFELVRTHIVSEPFGRDFQHLEIRRLGRRD